MTTMPQQQNTTMVQSPAVDRIANYGQHQIAIVQQQPYSDITATDGPRHRHKKTLRGLGITECVIGGISVLLAVIADTMVSSEASYYYNMDFFGYDFLIPFIIFTYVSTGIWCGIFIIITGILGIRVMNTPSRCMHIANMTMAIITAVIVSGGTVTSVMAAAFSAYSITMVILHSLIAILCFFAMILVIIHSAFCCSGSCRGSSVSAPQIMAHPQQVMIPPQPQYVQGPNGQLLMVVDQRITPRAISPVPTAFNQITTNAPPVVAQMPCTSAQQFHSAYEDVSGKAPPAYCP